MESLLIALCASLREAADRGARKTAACQVDARQSGKVQQRAAFAPAAERPAKFGAEARLQGRNHRLIDLIAARPDAGTHHRPQGGCGGELAAQSLNCPRDHAPREAPPSGMNRSHCAARFVRQQDRHTVRGHHSDTQSRHAAHNGVGVAGLCVPAWICIGDFAAMLLPRPNDLWGLRAAPHSESVGDPASLEQRMGERLHG
jgi:hypothetical protein